MTPLLLTLPFPVFSVKRSQSPPGDPPSTPLLIKKQNKTSAWQRVSASARLLLPFLTTLYLALPVVIFAFGWLRAPYSILLAAWLAGLLAWLAWETRRETDVFRWRMGMRTILRLDHLAAAVLLLIWLALSGTGGFGYQNPDYYHSNALFKDLIDFSWPLQLEPGVDVPLVYYFGYYLPAALFGRLFGWGGANYFLFAWTFAGLLLAFTWFQEVFRAVTRLRPTGWRIAALACLFCLCGGLDLVPALLRYGGALSLSGHYEIWASFMQYSSQTTLLFWVPQHAIAGWLISGLVVWSLYEQNAWKYLGTALACAALWSPFSLLGVLPFLTLLGVRLLQSSAYRQTGRRDLLPNLAAVPLGLVLLLFLGANQFSFPLGFAWEFVDPGFYARLLPAFLLLEFGLLAALAALLCKKAAPGFTPPARWLFGTALLALCLLPLFRMGFRNDLVMRASIPALFVFWALIAALLLHPAAWRKAARLLAGLALLALALGFFPAAAEITRSLGGYTPGPPPEIDYRAASDAANRYQSFYQRSGDPEALFFRVIGKMEK